MEVQAYGVQEISVVEEVHKCVSHGWVGHRVGISVHVGVWRSWSMKHYKACFLFSTSLSMCIGGFWVPQRSPGLWS